MAVKSLQKGLNRETPQSDRVDPARTKTGKRGRSSRRVVWESSEPAARGDE